MINEENLKRVKRDQAIAEASGFKLAHTLYPLGTDVLSIGVDNYKRSRKEYEELPDVEEAAEFIINTINAENRVDEEFALPSMYMNENNQLNVEDLQEYLVFTPWSLRQLIERTRPYDSKNEAVSKAASYIADEDCPSYYKQLLANHYLNSATNDKGPLKAIFRRRDIKDRPDLKELYAVVSDRYNTDCDTDSLAKMINRKVENSGIPARSEVFYDMKRFRMSILYHSDVKTPVVGELFKAGVIIDSADDGSRSIRISPMVMRNLCLNFIILDKATQTVSISHLKNSLYNSVSEAIDEAMAKVSEFGERWAAATRERIMDSVYEDAEPQEVFTQLVKQGLVKAPGTSKKDLIEKLVSAYEREPGHTGWQKATIINAITRAAHESPWSSPWTSSELEESAGHILYNKVFLNLSDES